MEQSRIESLLEALANQVVAISYAVGIYVLLGLTPVQGLGITLVFSVLGLVRVYIIRRIVIWWRRRREDG